VARQAYRVLSRRRLRDHGFVPRRQDTTRITGRRCSTARSAEGTTSFSHPSYADRRSKEQRRAGSSREVVNYLHRAERREAVEDRPVQEDKPDNHAQAATTRRTFSRSRSRSSKTPHGNLTFFRVYSGQDLDAARWFQLTRESASASANPPHARQQREELTEADTATSTRRRSTRHPPANRFVTKITRSLLREDDPSPSRVIRSRSEPEDQGFDVEKIGVALQKLRPRIRASASQRRRGGRR